MGWGKGLEIYPPSVVELEELCSPVWHRIFVLLDAGYLSMYDTRQLGAVCIPVLAHKITSFYDTPSVRCGYILAWVVTHEQCLFSNWGTVLTSVETNRGRATCTRGSPTVTEFLTMVTVLILCSFPALVVWRCRVSPTNGLYLVLYVYMIYPDDAVQYNIGSAHHYSDFLQLRLTIPLHLRCGCNKRPSTFF